MKIGGVDPKLLPTKIPLVLPRGDQQLVFWAQGLQDRTDFDNQVPMPKPPGKHTPKGWVPEVNEPGYTAAMVAYNKRWLGYLVIKSLEPSDIEWDTVKLDVPGTWTNWEDDLKNGAGLNQNECNLVLGLVWEANSLDEVKLAKARETFLRGPQEMPVA
jgi:hypothetical protein